MRNLLPGVLLWTLVGLVFSLQVYVSGRPTGVDLAALGTIMLGTMPDWYAWGILAPLFMRSERLVIGADPPLVKRVLFHVPASFIWVPAQIALASLFAHFLRGSELPAGLGAIMSSLQWELPTYYMVVGAYTAWNLHRTSQERALQASRLESLLAQARLDTLRAQLHPHFLFNTLNAISAFVGRDPVIARKLTADLGDLLRAALELGEKQRVTLAEELEFIDSYLAIQQVRFEGKLQVRREIDPATLGELIPPLLLQPLVENAIQHGTRGGRGTVTITAARSNGTLTLAVRDDGPGVPAGWSLEQSTGVGLRNTAERMHHVFGNSAALSLTSANGAGAVAQLTLPATVQ